jgi:molecular chaperone GrpE
MQKADEQQQDGVVLEQYQKGYKLNGRLIRPAMVVVNKLPENEQPPIESNDEEKTESEKD